MDQILFVGGRQAAASIREDLQNIGPRARLGVHPVPDCVTLDELHGDEDLVLEGAHVVHHHHVRVRQFGDGLRLAHHAPSPFLGFGVIARLPAQQLDRDLTIQLWIVGRVDLAHRPLSHQVENQIAAYHGRTTGFLVGLGRWYFQRL